MKTTGCVVIGLVAAAVLAAAGCKRSSVSGPHGTELTLHKPANQSMSQGESNKVSIAIDRKGFADPVGIVFSNFPGGITVDADTMPASDERKDFTLIASPVAEPAAQRIVTVTARGPGIETHQTFELTVKEKK